MTEREAFQATLRRNQRAIDAERREFADRVSEVVAGHLGYRRQRTRLQRLGDWVMRRVFGRQPPALDMLRYALIRRDLEPIFDEFYGQWPGDRRARFWRLIVTECRDVRAGRFAVAVRDVRRRLPADLRRAIETEAA
jgi:hypothetical protein